MTAADCFDAVTEPRVIETEAPQPDAKTYYELFLSYSANFAGGYQPNPPGSGYHWSLLPSRLKMSPGFAAKVASRRLVAVD